jgi:hypothetical protein
VLISKIRLKPATIGVVRSCATPQTVKQLIKAMNSSSIPRPNSGGRLPGAASVVGARAMLAISVPSAK